MRSFSLMNPQDGNVVYCEVNTKSLHLAARAVPDVALHHYMPSRGRGVFHQRRAYSLQPNLWGATVHVAAPLLSCANSFSFRRALDRTIVTHSRLQLNRVQSSLKSLNLSDLPYLSYMGETVTIWITFDSKCV